MHLSAWLRIDKLVLISEKKSNPGEICAFHREILQKRKSILSSVKK